MVASAMAQETLFVLRRKIAKLEGTLPATLDAPSQSQDGRVLVRRAGSVTPHDAVFSTGVKSFDAALGGGVPRAALTEIHGQATRDSGAVAGFALALAALLSDKPARSMPFLWIGTAEIFREAGFPYARGLSAFGLRSGDMLFAEVQKLTDALWVAEEAASLKALSAVILEVRGNPARLDLNATRRLHVRAQRAGRPVFLLRQAAQEEATAAPVRLVVAPAHAGLRATLAGPLPRSIGPPAFTVILSKSRTAMHGQFTLEWNADGRFFHDRKLDPEGRGRQGESGSEDFGAVFSLSRA